MLETSIIKITTFENLFNEYTPEEFKQNNLLIGMRVFIDTNNQCWFVGNEVAARLGYKNPREAIRDHVDNQFKRGERIAHPLGGGLQNTILIHEHGLYQLILKSNIQNSVQFQNYVFFIIENMRRYGMALSPQRMEEMLNPVYVLPEDMKNTILQMKQNEINYKNTINTLEQDNIKLRNSNEGLWEDVQVISFNNLARKYDMSPDYFRQLLLNLGLIYYNDKEDRYVIDRTEAIDVYNPLISKDDADYIENELRKYNIYKQ